MAKNELAILDKNACSGLIPTGDDLEFVREAFSQTDILPFVRIKIGAAGVNMFQTFEPGSDDAQACTDIEGIILTSRKNNGLWLKGMGEAEDKSPDCASQDGITGIMRDTGEVRECAKCPYNAFGSAEDGRGKRCKNMRTLYILRKGELFPAVLVLPPTGIRPFENYRLRLLNSRRFPQNVVTRITLKKEKSAAGIAYSVPEFNAVGALSPEDVSQLQPWAGMLNDLFAAADKLPEPAASAPIETGFAEVSDADVPAEFAGDEYAPL